MVEVEMELLPSESFAKRLDLELKRAERYRIFVSTIVFDLSFVKRDKDIDVEGIVNQTVAHIRNNIREIDNVAVIGDYKIGLLFPETPRQGAEIASKRIAELIRNSISNVTKKEMEHLIPMEMVSYPDAAGAKSLSEFLKELTQMSRN
jgi:GGDEF domain-containing protein